MTSYLNCPEPPPMTPTERGNKAAELIKAMGVQSCDTDNMTAAFHGEANVMLASLEVTATYNQTSTIGCEPIIVSSNQYNKLQSNISCIIKRNCFDDTFNMKNINSIVITAGESLDITCPTLSIDQSINVKMVRLNQLTNEDKTDIKNAVEDTIKNTVDNVLEQKTELGSVVVGGKDIRQVLTDIKNSNMNQQVSEVINNISTTIENGNTLVISAGKNLRLTGDQCIIKQDIVADIVATAIAQNSLSTVFENMSKAVNESDEKRRQVYDAKGLSDFIDKLRQSSSTNLVNSIVSAIVGLIILIVILGIGYSQFKKDGSGGASGGGNGKGAGFFTSRLKLFFGIIICFLFFSMFLGLTLKLDNGSTAQKVFISLTVITFVILVILIVLFTRIK
jgi:hypothetical protein